MPSRWHAACAVQEYEDRVRRSRTFINEWLKYAHWEEEQGEFERARSVYERALDVDHQYVAASGVECSVLGVPHARCRCEDGAC